jgi:hypothetical protein
MAIMRSRRIAWSAGRIAACVVTVACLLPSIPSVPRARTMTTVAATACTIFPADNVWHKNIATLPLSVRSAKFVRSVGATRPLHPDFGSGTIDGAPFGMPITAVTHSAAAVHIKIGYADESSRGPYRIPATARVEGGNNSTGDRHVIVWDKAACVAYELWNATRHSDGSWTAGSGAIFNLRSNALRTSGWTSADAAGLPIIAGLVRYDEVAAGRINHAIRMTVPRTDRSFIWPARHFAASRRDLSLPPMGLRFRLKKSVDITKMPQQARVVAQALKSYGAIVADNGSSWFISGTQDPRWDNDQLNALKALKGSDFVAVSERSLQVSANSARAR